MLYRYVRGNQQDCVIGPAGGGGGAALGSLEGKGDGRGALEGRLPWKPKSPNSAIPAGMPSPYAPIGCLATREVQLSRNMSQHLLTTPPHFHPRRRGSQKLHPPIPA